MDTFDIAVSIAWLASAIGFGISERVIGITSQAILSPATRSLKIFQIVTGIAFSAWALLHWFLPLGDSWFWSFPFLLSFWANTFYRVMHRNTARS